jgi:hypothetical protein
MSAGDFYRANKIMNKIKSMGARAEKVQFESYQCRSLAPIR